MAPKGFTLIELLVVVTIIVILIALLLPAMEKAIYQAEMATCATNQKGLTTSSAVYAVANKRLYPQPPDSRGHTAPGNNGYQPDLMGWEQLPGQDMRPLLKDYFATKMFVCPLAPAKLDFSFEGNDTGTQVFTSYYYYPGWKWIGPLGGRGLFRLGDNLTFIDNLDSNKTIETRVMTMDRHITHTLDISQSMHQDKSAILPAFISQGGPYGVVVLAGVGVGGGTYTFSIWQGGGNGTPSRGLVDYNYGLIDGSIARINDIELRDKRMHNAPAHVHSDHAPDWKIQIPQGH